jgi:hypothetical protein
LLQGTDFLSEDQSFVLQISKVCNIYETLTIFNVFSWKNHGHGGDEYGVHNRGGRNTVPKSVPLFHRLADRQIRIAILSLPLKEKWRHFLQERRHFSLRLRARGEFRAKNFPRAWC